MARLRVILDGCRYATPPDAPLEAALQAYTDAAATAETAPRPTPLYAEKLGWLPGQRRTSDLAFTLLQLATGRLALDNPHDVAQLLSAESYAPEPLSALHGWLILQTLTAIGVAESTPALHQQVTRTTSPADLTFAGMLHNSQQTRGTNR